MCPGDAQRRRPHVDAKQPHVRAYIYIIRIYDRTLRNRFRVCVARSVVFQNIFRTTSYYYMYQLGHPKQEPPWPGVWRSHIHMDNIDLRITRCISMFGTFIIDYIFTKLSNFFFFF